MDCAMKLKSGSLYKLKENNAYFDKNETFVDNREFSEPISFEKGIIMLFLKEGNITFSEYRIKYKPLYFLINEESYRWAVIWECHDAQIKRVFELIKEW